MSVVYPYLVDKYYKSLLYYLSGPTDVALILDQPGVSDWEDMGKSGKAQAKEPELVSTNAPPLQQNPQEESHGKLFVPQFRRLNKKSCCTLCTKILYVVLGIITVLQSIALIAVAVTTAIATKIYSNELSGRLVAMVMLAVTAAVTVSVTIYAVIGVIRKQRRPVHAASVMLMAVILMQAIFLGVSVKVTAEDEVTLSRSLSDSFRLARDDNPRHVKIWARTQHDLSCCGVYSAEDYRAPNFPVYFAPNVPISCCPSYNPDRSELVQERERESCKARKEYHDIGCRNLIIDVFKDTSQTVMGVCLLAIVLEAMIILTGIILTIKTKPKPKDVEEDLPAVDITIKKTTSKSVG